MHDESTVIIRAWNTVLFEKFLRFRHVVTDGLAGYSDEIFRRGVFPEGSRVLDIGCGFGDTTLQLARLVGPAGLAVGVDCAERFIQLARESAGASQLENAKFVVADAQSESLGGPYEHVFSRFGTMFFSFPGAALRNIGRSLIPGGKLSMIVWRRREANDWLYEAELCVRGIVPVVSHEQTDQPHCGPGPFSMAGPDLVLDLLHGAGFRHVAFECLAQDICIGRDSSEAVEFALALGPAGEILRLAGEEGARLKPQVTAALTETLQQFERSDGFWAPSSAWFITAQSS